MSWSFLTVLCRAGSRRRVGYDGLNWWIRRGQEMSTWLVKEMMRNCEWHVASCDARCPLRSVYRNVGHLSTFDAAHTRKAKFYTELQPRKPKVNVSPPNYIMSYYAQSAAAEFLVISIFLITAKVS
jgi:hypothetical protein